MTQLAVRAQRDLLLAEKLLDAIPQGEEEPKTKRKKKQGA